MSFLEIKLFNGLQVKVGDRPITRFYSQKTKGLLVYLALEAIDRPQARAHLATLLWPEYPSSRARRNLSQTLTSLRKDLGDQALSTSLFDIATQAIGLHPSAELSIDVQRFEEHLSAVRDHEHTNLSHCTTCTEWLKQAADLYTGPLLDQFDAGDSNPFEDWFVAKRENLLQQGIETFIQLGKCYAAQGYGDEGLRATDRLLELAPWQERAHRLRMLLLAQNGRRIQALNQYDILSDVLMQELGVSPSSETDELYDKILAGEIEAVSPAAVEPLAADPITENLPDIASPFQAPPTSPYFVGRQQEIKQIQQFIEDDGDVLYGSPIALVGMGGVGKSALATYKAHQLKEKFPDGILWGNPLTSDPQNILDMWARAYGSDFSGLTDIESKSTAVRGLLAHKKTLIVLDNVEDAASVRPLLPSGGSCQVLLTTRNLEAATSLNAQLVHMREFSMESSHKLMARIIGTDRILGPPEQVDALQQISKQLHHLPLAIEIAAQRLRSRPSMPLDALAMRLGDTKQRLGLKISDQAVRTSFEVSWGGLTQAGQQVFAGMAVFAGRSFTAVALAAVVDFDLFDLEDELYSLIALSLVSSADGGRFSQHPLLADFAAEKLAGDKSTLLAHKQRLVSYYLAFVEDVGEDFGRLTPEWDNLAAVIQTAYNIEHWEQLLALADSLTPAWKARGRYSQARQAYPLAQEAAQKLGDEKQEALIFLRWGEAALEQNDYETAEKQIEESLTKYYRLEDGRKIAQSQYQLARSAIAQNQFEKADKLLQDVQPIYESLGDKNGLADVLVLLGHLSMMLDRRAEAIRALERAEALYQMTNNQIGIIDVYRFLAANAFEKMEDDRAEELALKAKNLSEQIQEKAQYASSLYLLIGIFRVQGKLKLAQEYGEECLIIMRQTGRLRTEGLILHQLSFVYNKIGDSETAFAYIQQSISILETVGDKRSCIIAMRYQGDLYRENNQEEQSTIVWQAAYTLATQVNIKSLIDPLAQRLKI